jgi:asparagine synthase (glutamine-hydrolysing)
MAKWWDILEHRVQVPKRFENRVEYFQELFEDAVRLRLRNDVDTGVCLSGGMDSSAVYGTARKLQKMNLAKSATSGKDKVFRVFSVSYPDSPVDEYPWVEKCLEFWDDKEQASIVYPKPETFPELIDEVVWHQEAPVWSSSVFAFHILYRHIASLGTKVILEGHGSDEMLGGYPYMVQAAIRSFAARRNLKLTWDSANCLVDTRNPALQEFGPPAWRIFMNLFPLTRLVLALPSWMKSRFKQAIIGKQVELPHPKYTSYMNLDIINACPPMMASPVDSLGKFDQELYAAFTQRILPIVLRVFDRATMAYGVESRAPFMDYRIVQFMFSLREEDKVARETKHILRTAAKDWVPTEVIDRKGKMGFAVAEREWFNSKIVSGYLADIFHSADALNSSLFDGKSLAKDLDTCIKEGFSWRDTTRIWEVLNIYLWHKRFVETAHSEVT